MLALFHSLGKHSLSKQFLKRITSGFEIEEAHVFMIQINISSCPLAILGSNDLIIFKISSEQNLKVDNLSNIIFAVIELLLPTAVHY